MYKYLEPYAAMVEFLGKALGDNVEIALHDLTSKEQEICLLYTSKQYFYHLSYKHNSN